MTPRDERDREALDSYMALKWKEHDDGHYGEDDCETGHNCCVEHAFLAGRHSRDEEATE